jgi:hypothetical protein
VIQPANRLVTHVVVRSYETLDTNLVTHENVVPVQDFERVNDKSAFLRLNGKKLAEPDLALNAYPVFDPDTYPLAPFTWKAPYPYSAGEVLWSFEEILTPVSQPGARPETKSEVEIATASEQMMAQGAGG